MKNNIKARVLQIKKWVIPLSFIGEWNRDGH